MPVSSTATLQNSVRIRIFLILVLSIAMRITRTFSSDSVKKATELLEINYIVYGLVLLCSLLPFRVSWMAALAASVVGVGLGLSAFVLGTVSTFRCLTAGNAGCLQTAPGSIVSLILAGVIVGLDVLQSWTMYLILRYPSFVSSAHQRIRILFSWALPFGWLITFVLLYESSWSPLVAAHLMGDPAMIVLAGTKETILLVIVIAALLISDLMALFLIDVSPLVTTAIGAQLVLTIGSLAMIAFSKAPAPPVEPSASEEDEEPAVGVIVPSDEKKLRLRPLGKNKSSTGIIKF